MQYSVAMQSGTEAAMHVYAGGDVGGEDLLPPSSTVRDTDCATAACAYAEADADADGECLDIDEAGKYVSVIGATFAHGTPQRSARCCGMDKDECMTKSRLDDVLRCMHGDSILPLLGE